MTLVIYNNLAIKAVNLNQLDNYADAHNTIRINKQKGRYNITLQHYTELLTVSIAYINVYYNSSQH